MGVVCGKKVCDLCVTACDHCFKNLGNNSNTVTIGSVRFNHCCDDCAHKFKSESFKNHDRLMREITCAIEERKSKERNKFVRFSE
jgi:hypothetical protein